MISTLSSTPAGTTMGRKESECGQMGVIMIAGTLGWIMEAPAATAYAVLPVGVDTIRPGEARETGRGATACPVSTERIHDRRDKRLTALIMRSYWLSESQFKDNIPTVVE